MKISAEEQHIIQEILELHEKGTTNMVSEVMHNPVSNYADPNVLDREIKTLFRDFPIILAHSSELAEAGDYMTHDETGMPLLVVRTQDGTIKAYLNVCRHRGARLTDEPCGKARTFSCPYHAWTFGLDGKLRGMPQPYGFDTEDKKKLGLIEVPAFERYGMIWVVPSVQDKDIDLDKWMAPLDEQLKGLDLGNHVVYKKWKLDRDMGWRIALEGFQESYHFCSAHRDTACSGYLDNQSHQLHFHPHVRHAVPLPNVLELKDQDPETWEYRPHFMTQNYIFPANFVQVMSDHVYIHTIIPTGPGTCSFQCMMLIPEAPKTEKAERYWAKNYELIRIVFNEDFVIGEGIQKGLNSGANAHFTFGKYECGLHFGQKAIDEALEGKLKVPTL